MRVLQLIDSLDAGGAERMAVTFANALATEIEGSHLCATRAEGLLKDTIHPEVGYLFLRKKTTIDLGAVFRLRKYIKAHNIDRIHAHTTSYFFATMVKWALPKVRIIWHAHLGERVKTKGSDHKTLRFCSKFFSTIITVNEALKAWCVQHLKTKKVHYLPNFVVLNKNTNIEPPKRDTTLICVANLKTPKNHHNLVKAFAVASVSFPSWKLKLIGRDFQDEYATSLKALIKKERLENKVVLLGQQAAVQEYLQSASIGVLASDSEGLPMALLEYGAAGLAVIATDVGQCSQVIGNKGRLVPAKDSQGLADAMLFYMEDHLKRRADAEQFHVRVAQHYSVAAVIPQLLTIYKNGTH